MKQLLQISPLPVDKTRARAGVINARVYSVSCSDFFTKFTTLATQRVFYELCERIR